MRASSRNADRQAGGVCWLSRPVRLLESWGWACDARTIRKSLWLSEDAKGVSRLAGWFPSVKLPP